MRVIELSEAKANLSRLVDEAAKGEPFVIARDGKPLVKVLAVQLRAKKSRRIGFLAGAISVPDDFDSMGRTQIERTFSASVTRRSKARRS